MIYSLHSVRKTYSQGRGTSRALDGITLQVASGEHVGLLGQSGAGKSTLFRLMNGTIRPTGGSVQFEGRDINGMTGVEIRRMRRRIGTIYQQHNLVPSLSALDNTLSGGLGRWSLAHTVRGMFRPHKADLEKAVHALESVGLADKRHDRADQLSGGQQQRVAIARALMQEPDVILADEPVASLDPALAEGIVTLLAQIASEGKRTLIVSLHSVDLALQSFPRTIGLRAGAMQFDMQSSAVDADLIKTLYSGPNLPKEQTRDEHASQPEFKCIS